MNEKLIFHISQNGQPLPISELIPIEQEGGGLIFNGETSAWPRGLRFGLQGVGPFKEILNLLRRQTARGEHRFNIIADNNSLIFTTLAPNRIPTGLYEYRLKIADLDIENSTGEFELEEDEGPVEIQLRVNPERRTVKTTATIQSDSPIADLVNGASRIDGKRIIDWLDDDAPRPKRKACLLNILAKLRTVPTTTEPLINFIQNIFLVDVSRIYAKVDPELFNQLQRLDQSSSRPLSLDRGPIHPGHLKLLRRLPDEDQDVTEKYEMSATTYHQLGYVAQEQRQFQQAEQYYQQALQICIEFNDRYNQARTYHQLGYVAEEQRQFQQAREYRLKALSIIVEYDDLYTTEIILRGLAWLWQESGDASLPAAVAEILKITTEEAEEIFNKALEG